MHAYLSSERAGALNIKVETKGREQYSSSKRAETKGQEQNCLD
jgi:hypothetical protein